MKKLVSLVLALCLVLASCAVAFAEDPAYKITVTNDKSNVSINGKTYYAYKVFDVTYSGSNANDPHSYSIKSTDWAWNYVKGTEKKDAENNGTGIYENTTYGLTFTPSASDPTLFAITSTMTADQARKLADDLEAHLPATADGFQVAANEKALIALTEPGYYIVYGTAKSNDPYAAADEVVAACALTTVDPSETIIPKVDVPELNKKITGEHVLDDKGKAAVAEVGTQVSYELDSAVPDLNGYTDYTFTFHDKLTAGLDYVTNSFELKINNAKVDIAPTINGREFSLTIPFSTLSAYTKGTAIVLTYKATVNSSALTTDYEKNTAYLEYTHSPYDNTTNRTPDKETYVIDVDINVDKIANGDTTKHLDGAKFKVFKGDTIPADDAEAWYKWDATDATNKKVTWVTKANADTFETNTDGKFVPNVQGLEAEKTGTKYGLLETEAPKGYNPLKDPIIVTLTATYTENDTRKEVVITAANATMTKGTVNLKNDPNSDQPLATAQVNNESGTELPSTGGIGTTIFYILGGLMVIGAAVILVARRKAGQN